MGCARGGGHIAGKLMPGVPCEQGEGDGFLGFGRNAVVVGGLDAATERRNIVGEHAHQCGIACAATGDDVVDWLVAEAGRDEILICESDAPAGKRGGGGEYIVRLKAMTFCEREEAVDEGGAVLLASGAFGGKAA